MHEDELEAEISTWTVTRTPAEVTALLQSVKVPAAGSLDNRDLANDPHLNETGIFVELPHLEVGTLRHIGIPWRMSRTPCKVEQPAPCLGQHTDAVMTEVLGYSADQVADLKEQRILY